MAVPSEGSRLQKVKETDAKVSGKHKNKKDKHGYSTLKRLLLNSLSASWSTVMEVIPDSKPRNASQWRRVKLLATKSVKATWALSKQVMFVSPTKFYLSFLESVFRAHGLVPEIISVGPDTKMECWRTRRSSSKSGRKNSSLLLLHGFGASAIAQWDSQVPELCKSFDLYIPNLVFFGNSFTKSANRSMDFQAECVMALLDTFGVQRFDVAGFSYGGAIAYRLAAKYEDRVRRVIIADEGIMMNKNDMAVMQQELDIDDGNGYWKLPRKALDVKKLEEIAFRNPMKLPKCLYQDAYNAMFSKNQKEWDELVYEYTDDRPDNPYDNPRLLQETLLTWGEDDPMAPLRFGKMLLEHIGKKCRLVIVKDAKHMAHAQYPREFNQLVKDFLLLEDLSLSGNPSFDVVQAEKGDALVVVPEPGSQGGGTADLDGKDEGSMSVIGDHLTIGAILSSQGEEASEVRRALVFDSAEGSHEKGKTTVTNEEGREGWAPGSEGAKDTDLARDASLGEKRGPPGASDAAGMSSRADYPVLQELVKEHKIAGVEVQEIKGQRVGGEGGASDAVGDSLQREAAEREAHRMEMEKKLDSIYGPKAGGGGFKEDEW